MNSPPKKNCVKLMQNSIGMSITYSSSLELCISGALLKGKTTLEFKTDRNSETLGTFEGKTTFQNRPS